MRMGFLMSFNEMMIIPPFVSVFIVIFSRFVNISVCERKNKDFKAMKIISNNYLKHKPFNIFS